MNTNTIDAPQLPAPVHLFPWYDPWHLIYHDHTTDTVEIVHPLEYGSNDPSYVSTVRYFLHPDPQSEPFDHSVESICSHVNIVYYRWTPIRYIWWYKTIRIRRHEWHTHTVIYTSIEKITNKPCFKRYQLLLIFSFFFIPWWRAQSYHWIIMHMSFLCMGSLASVCLGQTVVLPWVSWGHDDTTLLPFLNDPRDGFEDS